MHRLLLLLVFVASYSYSQPRGNGSMSPSPELSGQDSARQLLDQALALMQRNPFKASVDWDSLAAAARERLSEASSCHDAYAVINECLRQVQNTHSFVMPAARAAVYHNDAAQLKRQLMLRELVGTIAMEQPADGIGYITVPWISTTDSAICTLLADSLQSAIASLAAQGVTRWVIDLRKNSGGNCWPMLAGIGPLLGNGVCGYFVRDVRPTAFRYENGAAICGRSVNCRVSKPVQLTPAQRQQIVVLTGPGTSSAGEIVALAFRGLPHVRLMGAHTAGFTTANTTYSLLDGSTLVLTVCQEADRRGIICEGKITPDDLIPADPLHKEDDLVKVRAVMWLQSL